MNGGIGRTGVYAIKKCHSPPYFWCRQSKHRGFNNRGMGINKVEMNFSKNMPRGALYRSK